MLALIFYLKFLDRNKTFKLFLSLCFSFYFGFNPNLFESGLKKCPECYGDELCRFFENQQIQLTWFSYFLSIFNQKLTKSVFFGVFNNTQVVLKKKYGRGEKPVGVRLNGDEVQNFILCANVENVWFLFDEIRGEIEGKTLWSDLRTSVEPLLLKYFQTQGNWPFPKYLGACGELIMEEYKGEYLTNFISVEYEKRMFLAVNLMKMAQLFTFGHSHLAFYFTDYSFDNLVVDSNGAVFLIDLDNVIISNKSAVQDTKFPKMKAHKSELLDYDNYAFSPSDICQSHISDHNYFSVCKYILSHPENGLLKNIPLDTEKNKQVHWLLDECSQPNVMRDRFSAGNQLESLLNEIIGDYKWQ